MNLALPHLSIKHLLPYLCVFLWALVCYVFFQTTYAYHFFYQEQNQLFLLSWTYCADYLRRPAWLASLAGDFLTQFYYYRYAGAAILTASLLVLGDLTRRSLQRIGLRHGTFAIAIVLMTLFALFSLQHSYRLASVIAADGGCALAWLVMLLLPQLPSARGGRMLTAVVLLFASTLTFWLFGNGGFLFLLLLIIYSVVRHRQRASLSVVAVALPLLLLPLTKHCYMMNVGDILSAPGLGKLAAPEWTLEKDWAADDEYYFGNWQRVTDMVEREKNPTEGQLFFYNLVKAQQGALPDVLLRFPNNYLGTFEKIGAATPLLIINRMNDLYWALGDMTFAERAAMQALAFSPDNRNVRMIRRLAEINMVTGNHAAANKFLGLLDHTVAYRRWAAQARANAAFYREKAKMTNSCDTLRTSDNAYVIMTELLRSNPKNLVALDYLLCSDLLLKEISTFKRDYDMFVVQAHAPRTTCRLYQQALMVWLAGTNAKPDEWRRYITLPDELQRFQAYNQQRGSAAFADTYWYWFDTHHNDKP